MKTKEIKYTNDEALAKIKILMNKFYQGVGREEFEDRDTAREDLMEDIDDILNKTNISQKHLIMAQFDKDKEEKYE